MTARTTIQLRRGTAAQWTAANPTLAAGEFGVETDTGKRKVGDGATAWASLPYSVLSTDSRLTDSRTPTAHATSHKSGGSDPIKLNELAAPTAAVALNSQKITGMANGAASGDGATYDQTPASTLTTQGDLLYASAANTPARLGIGTAYQVLRTNSGATAPEWVSGGIQLIAETVLSGTAASIDFTSIPSTFRHLRVVWQARSDRAGTPNDFMRMSVNNDTTDANYTQTLSQNGAVSSTANRLIANLDGATQTANFAASGTIDVINYAATTFYKDSLSHSVRGGSNQMVLYYATWKNTAAINRLTFTSQNSANFIAGTKFALYGIG